MPEVFTYRNAPPSRIAPEGALAGLRVTVQPNLAVRGWLCEAGSRALSGYTALQDATVVARLVQAGAVLNGSSRMAELGFGLAGDTSVRTIVDGHADVALITDTMGEVRLAAAGAGLFGLKPTYSLVSRHGLAGLVPSMESIGLAAADPGRIAETLAVMAGADPDDPSMPDDCTAGFSAALPSGTGSLTAGIIEESLSSLDPDERLAFDASVARLGVAGLAIQTLNLADYGFFQDVHHVIAAVEASSSAGKFDGVRYGHRSTAGKNWNEMYLNTRAESFGPLIKPFLFQGAYFQFERYPAFENACRLRGRLLGAVDDLLGQVDLIVLPTRRPASDAMRAATIEATYAAFALTLPASVTGHPVLQVPNPGLAADQDTGLQLIGRRLDDGRLLAIGQHLSSAARGGTLI